MRLFRNGSQKTPPVARVPLFLFIPHYDVFCDLLLNRRTTTWDLFVKGPCSPKRLCALVLLFWSSSFVECSNLIGYFSQVTIDYAKFPQCIQGDNGPLNRPHQFQNIAPREIGSCDFTCCQQVLGDQDELLQFCSCNFVFSCYFWSVGLFKQSASRYSRRVVLNFQTIVQSDFVRKAEE